MATPKQTTDGASGKTAKTPSGSDTAESGTDEQCADGDCMKSTDQVPVSEEFQGAVHKLVSKANRHHIMHMRNAISTREVKMRAEEKPDEFSDKEMPSQY